ncbi:MAG: hypothetical protein ACKVOK_17010 [Flavobacteriales bacterium]
MNEMFNLQIIEVLIAIVFVYAMLSILVSLLSEMYVSYVGRRSKFLYESIVKILNDPTNLNYGELLYNHPSIDKLKQTNTSWWHIFIRWDEQVATGYIASNTFSDALVDVIVSRTYHLNALKLEETENGLRFADTDTGPDLTNASLQVRFRESLNQMQPSPLRDILEGFHLKAGGNNNVEKTDYADQLKGLIKGWFDDHMTQASFVYKRKQRLPLIFFSLIVVVFLNVDSIYMLKKIIAEPQLRAELNSQATQMVDQMEAQGKTEFTSKELLEMVANIQIDSARVDSIKPKESKNLLQIISKKDSLTLDSMMTRLAGIENQTTDSLKDLRKSYARELSILPIGYSRNEAPLSWKKGKNVDQSLGEKSKSAASLQKDSEEYPGNSEDYFVARRMGGSKAIAMYIVGMIISVFSLSFGAPFWFDLLSKLVNLRRGGLKTSKEN